MSNRLLPDDSCQSETELTKQTQEQKLPAKKMIRAIFAFWAVTLSCGPLYAISRFDREIFELYSTIDIFFLWPPSVGFGGVAYELIAKEKATIPLLINLIIASVASLIVTIVRTVQPGQFPLELWATTILSIFLSFCYVKEIIKDRKKKRLNTHQDRK